MCWPSHTRRYMYLNLLTSYDVLPCSKLELDHRTRNVTGLILFFSFPDSGIDVTEEDRENNLLMMNGLTAGHNNCEPLESINALRDTLRNLKQATDKAVVRFLVRSREVLREEIKSQSKLSFHSCTLSFMFFN